ncbi:MAG: signal peptide peptidase SppA, partial [Myxococcota bacterium]
LSLEPIRGVRLFSRAEIFGTSGADAGLSALRSLFAGLELSFGGVGALGAAIFTNDGDATPFTQQTYSIWVAPEKKRGVTEPIRRWHIIDLNETFSELPRTSLFSPANKDFVRLLLDLDEMSRAPSVKGVLLNISAPGLGYAQVWELRQRIKALEAANIPVVALLQSTSTKSVMIATACDAVWMTPNVLYEPAGVSSELLSYQGALEKLGVDAEFVRVRDYKTAPEQYVRPSPSDESLEQTSAYLDTLFDALVGTLADGRSKPREEVVAMIDSVPLTPPDALEQGYVDAIVYPDEVEKKLRDEYKARTFTKGWSDRITSERAWERKQKIAVIIASGAIVQGTSSSNPLTNSVVVGSGSLASIIERARTDPDVRGVVLRVDSPGGSALASDQIYRELRRLAQKKPVVTSMGNVAASGGYYIAAGSEELFATPLTLTGSIGIFSGKFSLATLGEMVGLSGTQLRRGRVAGPLSVFAKWDEAQRASVQRSMIYLYRLFLDQVAYTRPLSADEVDAVGRGRVWGGEAAKERKLVDHSGGLIDAVRRAEQLAGMEPNTALVEVANRSSPSALPGVSASLNALAGARARLGLAPNPSEELSAAYSSLRRLFSAVPKSALWPLVFEDGEALMLPPMIFEVR